MSTNSVCASVWPKPDFLKISSARCAWPTFASCVAIVFIGSCVAMPKATTTKASQPKTAVFQWLALQRPMRAAMLFECFRGDIACLSVGV